MSATRWNILLPGPSLNDLKERPPGKVVAANKAMLHPVVPDYWCAVDNPRRLQEVVPRLRKDNPVIWVPDKAQEAWKKLQLRNEFETWVFRRSSVPWFNRCKVMARTMFFAIEGAARQGAKDIVLYGCDMEGDDYFCGEGSNWAKNRWEAEGRCLRQLQEEARKDGVSLRKHGDPEGTLAQPPKKTIPEQVDEIRNQMRQRPTTPIRWNQLSAVSHMLHEVIVAEVEERVGEIVRVKMDQYGKPVERISERTGKPVRKYTKRRKANGKVQGPSKTDG